jgi:hypothetical protein
MVVAEVNPNEKTLGTASLSGYGIPNKAGLEVVEHCHYRAKLTSAPCCCCTCIRFECNYFSRDEEDCIMGIILLQKPVRNAETTFHNSKDLSQRPTRCQQEQILS